METDQNKFLYYIVRQNIIGKVYWILLICLFIAHTVSNLRAMKMPSNGPVMSIPCSIS